MKKVRGQGLVETAFILPVLLMAILGIIEAALLIQGYVTVQHSARSAARFAASYQPPLGACLDADGDGMLEDGVTGDADDRLPWPNCPLPAPWDANLNETEAQYHDRRVLLIQHAARDAAAGLRIDDTRLGYDESSWDTYSDQAGFFGVVVWGYPSFEADCNADPDSCLYHPGVEGLPVWVMVAHNVEIIDPFYRAIAPYVSVRADAQMLNEGIQVGFGDQPPPSFGSDPFGGSDVYLPTPEDTPEPTPDGTPEPTPEPTELYIDLSPGAENALPDDREHEFVATVTNDMGQAVEGARVSFAVDGGGFSYSGVGPRDAEDSTDALGQAWITLYGNEPMSATLLAWLDYDHDGVVDSPDEPVDSATKAWTVSGPYLTVSTHQAYPLDQLDINVMDHDYGLNPHRLLWCAITTTTGITEVVVADPVAVDAGTGDMEGIGFQIPVGGFGVYRLETHTGGGHCGSGWVAYSAPVEVRETIPDLVVASISQPAQICPQQTHTMTVVIENLAPVEATELFDVDVFIDPVGEPRPGRVGAAKQWVAGIGPRDVFTLTIPVWYESGGRHRVYVQVDSSDRVEEGEETNNVRDIVATAGRLCESDGAASIPCSWWDSSEDGYAQTTVETDWMSPSSNYAGNQGFTDPANAYSDDGNLAYRENDADGVSHVYHGYGLEIPGGATIAGIEVRVDWCLDSTYWTNEIDVQLSWDGGSSWSSTRSADNEASCGWNPGHYETVGGGSDSWGRTWLREDFSASNFRVRLTLDTGSSSRDFYIDWVPVRVTYSVPSTKYFRESSYNSTSTMLGLGDQGDAYVDWDDFDDPATDHQDPPVVRYNVDFDTTGTYYAWVRGRPCAESDRGCLQDAGSNNSVWISLDGKPASNTNRITSWAAGGFQWYNGPSIYVPSVGLHTVELRMREDGFEWAGVVLTTTYGSAGAPSGDGPPVSMCPDCAGVSDPSPWGEEGMPPGLLECQQLVQKGSFEGNPDSIFNPLVWVAQDFGWHSDYSYDGAMSLRLHASQGVQPECTSLAPVLSQTLHMPAEVYTSTTMVVSGRRLVAGLPSGLCGDAGSAEADDKLMLQMRDGSGGALGAPAEIVNGGVVTETWQPFQIDVTSAVSPSARAGQEVQLTFYGDHNNDITGTWFWLEVIRCDVCTDWPVPEPISGTASFGGNLRVLQGGIPYEFQWVDVWAYSQDGPLYHTYSIHDSTYSFRNIEPGTYTVYAEVWIGGVLRYHISSITVAADVHDYVKDITLN